MFDKERNNEHTCLIFLTKMFAENKNITDFLKKTFAGSDADTSDPFFKYFSNPEFIREIDTCLYYQYIDIVTMSNIYLAASFIYSRVNTPGRKKEITKLLKKHYPKYYNNYNTSIDFEKYVTKFDYEDITVFIHAYTIFNFLNVIVNGKPNVLCCKDADIFKKFNFLQKYFNRIQTLKKNKVNKEDSDILKRVSDFTGGLLSTNLKSNYKFWHKEPIVEFLSDFSIEHGMLLSEIYNYKYSKIQKESFDVFMFYFLAYLAKTMNEELEDEASEEIFACVGNSVAHMASAYGRLLAMYCDTRSFVKKLIAENDKMAQTIMDSDSYTENEINRITGSLQEKIAQQQEQLNEKQKEIDRLKLQLAEKDSTVTIKTEQTVKEITPVVSSDGEDIVINLGAEKEFFRDEFKGFILSALRNELKRIEGSNNKMRRIDALKSVLLANESIFDPEKSASLTKAALKQDKNIQNWTMTEGKKHNKLNYFGDSRYQVTVAKTASDCRASENLASTMINVAY